MFKYLAALVLFALVLAGAYAPYVFTEYYGAFGHHEIVDPLPVKIARGRMVDDYFQVEEIAPGAWAIGEPRYYQQNYSYLVVGHDRALMIDAGTGTRNIMSVIRRLTALPVTVIPSHLHFDHTGGIGAFSSVAMLDVPELRAEVHDGLFRPGRYEFFPMADRLQTPQWRVSQWVKPGGWIELGGRRVQVLNTPGHTPTSVMVFDPAAKMLFTGDYIYPTTLYAFSPGASLSAYRQTAARLLATIPADVTLWTAHCCRAGEDAAAPWLSMKDLADLSTALCRVQRGEVASTGVYPRRFPVSRQMTLATGFPWTGQ